MQKISIEGRLYNLTDKQYDEFRKRLADSDYGMSNSEKFSQALEFVEDNGEYLCTIEQYNY